MNKLNSFIFVQNFFQFRCVSTKFSTSFLFDKNRILYKILNERSKISRKNFNEHFRENELKYSFSLMNEIFAKEIEQKFGNPSHL